MTGKVHAVESAQATGNSSFNRVAVHPENKHYADEGSSTALMTASDATITDGAKPTMAQMRRSSSVSSSFFRRLDRRRKQEQGEEDLEHRNGAEKEKALLHGGMGSSDNALGQHSGQMLRTNTKISPDSTRGKRTSLETPRDSSVMRTKQLTEFGFFLKIMEDVAIHYVTLYFINANSSAVITKMEQSFSKYYANSQKKLYLRGLAVQVLFMTATFAYEYVLLYGTGSISARFLKSRPSNADEKFYIVVGFKAGVVLPVILLTYIRAKRHRYLDDFWLTWICVVVVSSYPLIFNKLTSDAGVTWLCLQIMYIYSCTPIRFFPCSVFCLLYLVLYVVVMLASFSDPDSTTDTDAQAQRANVSRETVFACLFYFLILISSQTREIAIRVSYMSELMVLLQQEQLRMEEGRSKSLLNSMLPESIVAQLQSGRELIADEYPQATVLFCEVCDFDYFSSKMKPQQVVELLNIIFSKFDKLVDVHQVHKVETIGAVYMVVGGCPDAIPNHTELVANLAMDMIRCMPDISDKIARKAWGDTVKNLNVRIGINTGGLMAGVLGIRNPRFKLFGDTVNVASRMETTNLPGQIQITEATNRILCDKYVTTMRGKVFVKGRGDMNTYFLRGKGNVLIPLPPVIPPSSLTPPAASPSKHTSHAHGFGAQNGGHGSHATAPEPQIRHATNPVIGAAQQVPSTQPIPPSNAESNANESTSSAEPSHPPLLPQKRSSNARHPRRQGSRNTQDIANKQSSLADLLTIASSKPPSTMTTTQEVLATQLSTAKANEVLTSTIAATPQSQNSDIASKRRHGTITQLTAAGSQTLRHISSRQRSMFRENIFDIVEDAEDQTSTDVIPAGASSEVMKLPKGLTQWEVLFRVHSSDRSRTNLSREAYEFEESYRLENRGRQLRLLRLTMLCFIVMKPFITLYISVRLGSQRKFMQSHLMFVLNFCFLLPLVIAYVLFTFSHQFRRWEQSTTVVIILLMALVLNMEGMAVNSLGHAYLSVIALYQCYFGNVSFIFRLMIGMIILGVFLVSMLTPLFDNVFPVDTDSRDPFRVGRNGAYIFFFFIAQAWVVFYSEFKQRINHYREMTLNSQKQKLVDEEARITKLLLNLLPETIVHKLKEDPEATIADFFDSATVLFTDMVNFTAYSSKVSAMELVQFLNDMYTRFDTIAEKENLYKVEIIGDAYFVVGGCPVVSHNNALAVVTAATDMFAALPMLRRNCGVPDLNIRIGVHSGPVLAGVVGIKDPRYHLFGETVTIAHFLESNGVPGRIHISESTWARMNKDTPSHGFKVEYHTLLSINGYSKKIRTYFVL